MARRVRKSATSDSGRPVAPLAAPLFQALHWETLDQVTLLGHPHHFMQADLTYYPPLATPETGFLSHLKQAA